MSRNKERGMYKLTEEEKVIRDLVNKIYNHYEDSPVMQVQLFFDAVCKVKDVCSNEEYLQSYIDELLSRFVDKNEYMDYRYFDSEWYLVFSNNDLMSLWKNSSESTKNNIGVDVNALHSLCTILQLRQMQIIKSMVKNKY